MTSITLDNQRSQLEWFRLVREYQKSPLGKHAFCQVHKISRGDFRIWEQRLLEEESVIKAAHPSSFIPIAMTSSPQAKPTAAELSSAIHIKSQLQLKNSKGLSLLFPNGCEVRELKAVLEVLDADQ